MTNLAINLDQYFNELAASGQSKSGNPLSADLVNLAVTLQQALEQIKGQGAGHPDLAGLLKGLGGSGKENIFASLLPPATPEKEPTAPTAPSSPSNSNSSSVGYGSLEIAMGIAGYAISKLTTVIGTTSANIGGMNAEMGQGMEAVYQNLQTQAANNLQSQENESGWDKFWHEVGKDLGVVVSACLIVGGLVTGNWEVSLAVGTLLVLKETGALSDLASGVADLCKQMGMDPKTAKVIGDIVADVVGAVACVTAGQMGSFIEGGAEKAAGLAKDGAKGAEKLVDDAAADDKNSVEMEDFSAAAPKTTADESTETLTTMTEEKTEKKFLDTLKEVAAKAGAAIKKVNPFGYTPKFVNEAALGFAQSWTSTQTSSAILQTIDFSNPTTQKWVEGIVGSMTLLTDIFVSGGALLGLSSGTVPKKTVNALLYKGLQATKLLAGIGMATAEVAQGATNVWEGVLTENNGKIQAELTSTSYVLDTISQDNQMNVRNSSQLITENFKELIELMGAPGSALSSTAESMYQA
jgi:hypothetical protein